MKTIAAVLDKINKPLQIEELIVPELKNGQVLVKIEYAGLCHSQLNEIMGLKGDDKFLPHTLGHEGSGVVEKIGPCVEKVKPGDRVVLTWIKGSGADVPGAQYRRKDGSFVNSGAISTFLTRAVVSENRLVKITDKMPLKEAALLGCAVPTGAGIIINTAKVSAGSSIAIFGLGGVGLSALLGAKFASVSVIIAVDVVDSKLEYAAALGATHTLNPLKENVVSKILSITGGRGVDFSIESAGKKEAMENAFQSVCDNAGLCVIAGNLAYGDKISINPFDLIKGKRIIGTWGGETRPDDDIPRYAEYYLSGKLNIEKLIAYTCGLSDVNKAFIDLTQGKSGRVLLSMAGE